MNISTIGSIIALILTTQPGNRDTEDQATYWMAPSPKPPATTKIKTDDNPNESLIESRKKDAARQEIQRRARLSETQYYQDFIRGRFGFENKRMFAPLVLIGKAQSNTETNGVLFFLAGKNEYVFIRNVPDASPLLNDYARVPVVEDGTYSYTTVMGGKKMVKAYRVPHMMTPADMQLARQSGVDIRSTVNKTFPP